MTPVDRVNIALTADAVRAVDKVRERTGMKKTDLVNRALLLYEFIEAETRAGRDLVLRDHEGREQVLKMF